MLQHYLVYCRHCGKAITEALPPDHPEFSKVVRCVMCNRELDATRGRFSLHPVRLKPEGRPSLLETSR